MSDWKKCMKLHLTKDRKQTFHDKEPISKILILPRCQQHGTSHLNLIFHEAKRPLRNSGDCADGQRASGKIWSWLNVRWSSVFIQSDICFLISAHIEIWINYGSNKAHGFGCAWPLMWFSGATEGNLFLSSQLIQHLTWAFIDSFLMVTCS